MFRSHTAATFALILATAAARGQSTWTGLSNDGNWNSTGNWSPFGVPNSPTAIANFTGNAVGGANISLSTALASLNFSNSSGSYFITATGGKTLTVGSITVAANVAQTQSISLSNSSSTLLLPAPSHLYITNNGTGLVSSLFIDATIAAPGGGSVLNSGAGVTLLSGSFAGGANSVGGVFTYGPGTLILDSDGTNLGYLALGGGTLNLNYSSNTTTRLGTGGVLDLTRGVLLLQANASNAVTQVDSNTWFAGGGHVDIQLSTANTGTVTLVTGAITRTSGCTADLNPITGARTLIINTSAGVTNGLLGTGPAYATVGGGSTWATVSGGAIVGLTTYGADTYTANTNVDVTTSASVSNVTANSLRFNSGNATLTLSGTNTLQSGGILVTPNATGGAITGGMLTAANAGELIVHQYNNSFTINSSLVSAAGLVKTGPGFLTLGGNNPGLTGPIEVNRGHLTVTNPAAVNSASEIDFRETRTNQLFTVQPGNNIDCTILPPIGLGNVSSGGTNFGADSLNSRVTLAGPISSVSFLSLATPISFSGFTTSGFNLTNTANSFTGTVTLSSGFLGITADGCLGNTTNQLVLNINSTTAGGLEFLNDAISTSRAITVNSPTRLIVDSSFTATMSGTVTSAASAQVVKAGPGTLNFGGVGSGLLGGITLAGGTLELNYTASTTSKLAGPLILNGGSLVLVPNASTQVTQNVFGGGTFLAVGHADVIGSGSGTLTLALGSINRSVGATMDVSTQAGANFTATTTAGSTNGLLGSGPAFATFGGGATWATEAVIGGPINGVTNYGTNVYTSTTNTDVTMSQTLGTVGAVNTNSLRFNTGNQTMTLANTLTLQSGGILVTPSASPAGGTITGSTLTAASSGELIVHVYNQFFTIASSIVSTGGLTKSGSGTLILSGANTGLTGPINVNNGSLNITTTAAVNSASQINFNYDIFGLQFPQAGFTIDLGPNMTGTVSPPIRLSAEGPDAGFAGTSFSTGNGSTNTRLTLAGVLSSAAGLTTIVNFTGLADNSSGFNLSNTNTFTGTVNLVHGFLGINADANLGNAANKLALAVGDPNQGGLEFLHVGITVARPVLMKATTRILSDGTDSNTITGPISGTGGLVKAGTGTLTLTNATNSYSGGTTVSAGTLRLGASNALPSGGAVTVAGGNLDLNGSNQTISSLTLATASGSVRPTVTTGIGTLTLGGDVTMTSLGAGPGGQIAGNLDLGGATRAVNITGFSGELYDLVISATVSGNGGVSYTGLVNGSSSVLALAGPNTYTGPTAISTGVLITAAANTLPATGAVNLTSNTAQLWLHANQTQNGVTAGNYNQSIGSLAGVAGSTVDLGSATLTIGNDNTITPIFGGNFIGTGSLIKVGTGSQGLTGLSNGVVGPTVNAGQIFLGGSNWGATTVNGGSVQIQGPNVFAPQAPLTVNGGIVFLEGFSQSIGSLAGTGGFVNLGFGQSAATLTVGNDNTSTTFAGSILSPGTLVKVGTGTLTLSNSGNSMSLVVNGGTVQTASDNTLGIGVITIGPLGTLTYTGNTSTGRTIANSGAITVAAGQTLTFSAATVGGGFLRGPGSYTVTGGSSLAGMTTFAATTINIAGSASFSNFTNGGTLTVAAGLAGTVTLNGFSNQGSASFTVGQDSAVNAAELQSYGTLTLNPGSFNGTGGNVTQLTNTGSSNLYFNGGSRTFISTVAQAANQNAGIDVHGNDAIIAGGLFVNNGFVYDSVGAGTHRIVADYGSLVKGAGFYQPLPKTINGGTFIAGNSPGHATTGTIVLGGPNDPNGGLSDFTWQINDAGPSSSYPAATGVSGPSANAARQVSGWGTLFAVAGISPVATNGNFRWDATPSDELTIHLQTLLAPDDSAGTPSASGGYGSAGDMTPGLMSDFDPTQSYSWRLFAYAGGYTGPTDTATLDASVNLDASGFLNSHAGRFDLVLNQAAQEMDLVYTPTAVPEPGTLFLSAAAGIGLLRVCRVRKRCESC
jgi:autotransporter-associated beta strand protein